MKTYFIRKEGTIKTEIPIRSIFENLKDGDYTLTIKRIEQKRSNNQNAYFHGVVIPMVAEEIGNIIPGLSENQTERGITKTKEDLIKRYCPKQIIRNYKDKRKRTTVYKRTSELTTGEFKKFIDDILLDFPFIPPPDNGNIHSLLAYYQEQYGTT